MLRSWLKLFSWIRPVKNQYHLQVQSIRSIQDYNRIYQNPKLGRTDPVSKRKMMPRILGMPLFVNLGLSSAIKLSWNFFGLLQGNHQILWMNRKSQRELTPFPNPATPETWRNICRRFGQVLEALQSFRFLI